jgi:SAM-dependent methyltransferase
VGNSPAAHFVCVDRARPSLDQLRATLATPTVELVQADLFALPFPPRSFDHVFVCFVLEHVAEPVRLLRCLKAVVRPGGTVTVIEGDHGSAFFHPTSAKARRTIEGLVEAQARAGGDAHIGRRLFPLLAEAGLRDVTVSPRFVYADDSRPSWVDGFTRKTFVAMVAGARTPVLRLGLIGEGEWDEGIADLERSADAGGTFCYTFFKATATVG